MASPCKQTEIIRNRKAKRGGRWRKNRLANHGSTKSREELFKVVKV